jgi:hypothetical protein
MARFAPGATTPQERTLGVILTTALAVDRAGIIYVGDGTRNAIVTYDLALNPQGSIDSFKYIAGPVPRAIALDDGCRLFYAADINQLGLHS